MSGLGDAAAAILAAQPAAGIFPAVGVLTRLTLNRGADHVGPVTAISNITVDVSGQSYTCGCSGAFMAEITLGTAANDAGQSYLGRQVKVELVGGDFIVAYTLDWKGVSYTDDVPVQVPVVEVRPPWATSADALAYWSAAHQVSADMPDHYATCLDFLTDTRI